MNRIALLSALMLIACFESSPYYPGAGPIPTGPWPEVRDGYWEGFEAGEVDLQGYSLVFVPRRGSMIVYEWSSGDGVRDFPFRPGNGDSTVRLELGDDDSAEYTFREMEELYFFGVQYSSMHVSSNGYVTFGEGSGSLSNQVSDHFQLPGVAALRGDLDPRSRGSVIVDEWETRVVVTFEAVPGFSDDSPNDFQIILHTNGVIEIHYVGIASVRTFLAGISNGLAGANPRETDFVGGAPTSEHCGDGRDNDGDGLIDCEDVDCADDVRFCGPGRELDCWNGADDDGDGLWDCEDPDCAEECGLDWEWDCWDGLDNDGDGLVDCDDWDCEEECWEEEWEFDCWDGWDNDGDGLVDCEDWDCEEECWEEREFDCWDGWDNDRDGAVDCEDDDCWEECFEEWEWDCWDGEDNDYDGLVDCEDDDCWEECGGDREFDCWDGRDNDGDGLVDCDDPDCWDECGGDGERDCGNGWDDDRDGLIDCNDPDCFGAEPACTRERNCSDGHDNDRDGEIDCRDADCGGVPPCGAAARGYWESFDEGEEFDLTETAVFFVADDAEPEGYLVLTERGFPFYLEEPGSGETSSVLRLGDDDFAEYELELMEGIALYGERYRSIFVSSNGFVTFGEGSSSTSSSASAHFELPAVSGYRTDLDPRSGGRVVVDEWFDHVTVTFDEVPFFGGPSRVPNSFQIIIMDDGSLAIQYLEIGDRRGGTIGVSNGGGSPFPAESDFSTL